MRVTVDAGHGGYDPGAVGPNGLQEKDVTLVVSKLLATKLQQAGIEVILTRDSDQTPWGPNDDLQTRCRIANEWGADLFVSVHCNSAANPAACGTETYAYKPGGQGERFARAVQDELIRALGLTDRGVKYANYYVLRYTNMPAILVELAFISNPIEERLLGKPDFQDLCATAIARGIGRVIGVQIIQEVLSMFKDVPANHWAAQDIQFVAQKGIIRGDEYGNFGLGRPVLREELAAVVARLLRLLGVQ